MARDLSEVIHQMQLYGIHMPASVDLKLAFRNYVRFRPDGEKRNKKTAWVRLFSWVSPSGKEFISGAFGVRGDKWEVQATDTGWSPAERQAHDEARKAAAKAAEAERVKDGETAAAKARRFWGRGKRLETGSDGHEYLKRKKVGAFGLRLGFNDRLLVPIADVTGEVHGLQYIAPDGGKIFGTGTQMHGRSHLLGELKQGVPLLAFGEGYATCASVHMAMQWPVVCAFDAGNLPHVVGEYRRLYPDLPFVMVADDDRFLLERLSERLAKLGIACSPDELRQSMDREWRIPDGHDVTLLAGWKGDALGVLRIEGTLRVGDMEQALLLENAGQAKAHAAAKKHNARVLTPFFADRAARLTDWNDLHCTAGLEGVAEQLRAGMEAPPEKPRANARAQRAEKGGGDGRKGKGGAGGRGGTGAGLSRDGEIPFIDRFILIYGTTTVWDEQVREILRLEALRVAYGKGIDWWLSQDDRKMVTQDRVVFDPSGQLRPPEHVNLFDRLPLTPEDRPDKCARIVEHVWNICQENDALCHWVMSWLAYPLQHPGAKMRTALVLHGRTEGTGKSMLGGVMRRIYGRYATSVGQAELQRDFNDWLSARLLILAEEVVTRQDRAHHQGMLQALITQPTVQINAKNMPTREEANHANFMFFSNQQVPVMLNPTDRRYTVIKVERQWPEEYFKAIEAELDDGGAEAFLHVLLNYDLKGFNQFTRPFENRDRMHLITLGMQPDQRFLQFWQAGFAGVPFCCCAAPDLYAAFKAWCRVNGERFVPTATAFGRTVTEEMERIKAPGKRSKRYLGYSEKEINDGDFPESALPRQGVVYFVPAELEVMNAPTDEDREERQAAPQPPPDPPDVTQPAYFNAKVQAFQKRLHGLLASARRAM